MIGLKNTAITAGLSVLMAIGASAQPLSVQTRTLANGMKILVHEDRAIPNVALYIFYRIGSRNERPGTTGLSHFFEHMMFNGAKKYGKGEFDRVMEGAGGSNNAYTQRDLTVYQDWFPSSALELIFDLEADRIANLSFDPEIVESERGVVANERRLSVDNNNFGTLDEQLWATAFLAHPYQWPVVGWMSDIEHWTLKDLRLHFSVGYSPSNATMVVVGAVEPEKVFDLAAKYLEPIPARDPPPKVTTVEPEQLGPRRVEVGRLAQLPLLFVGYPIPGAGQRPVHPLAVLRTVLFAGQSSRLYQSLVDDRQLALFVDSDASLSLDQSLFVIAAQPQPGIEASTLETALYQELARVSSEGITEFELAKAKNILLADFYRRIKTIDGKAQTLGEYEVYFGDYRKMFSAAEELSKVTVEDVKRVALATFNPDHRTVAILNPKSIGGESEPDGEKSKP